MNNTPNKPGLRTLPKVKRQPKRTDAQILQARANRLALHAIAKAGDR